MTDLNISISGGIQYLLLSSSRRHWHETWLWEPNESCIQVSTSPHSLSVCHLYECAHGWMCVLLSVWLMLSMAECLCVAVCLSFLSLRHQPQAVFRLGNGCGCSLYSCECRRRLNLLCWSQVLPLTTDDVGGGQSILCSPVPRLSPDFYGTVGAVVLCTFFVIGHLFWFDIFFFLPRLVYHLSSAPYPAAQSLTWRQSVRQFRMVEFDCNKKPVKKREVPTLCLTFT